MSKVEKDEKPKVEQKVAKEEPVTLEFKNIHDCQGCRDKLGANKKNFAGFEIVELKLNQDPPKLVVKGVRTDVLNGIARLEKKNDFFKGKISIVGPEKAGGSSDNKKTDDNGSEEKKKPAEGKGAKNGDDKTKKEVADGKKDGGDKKPSQSQPKLREPFNRRDYGIPIPATDMTLYTAAFEPSSATTWAPATYPGGQTFLKQILPMLPDACSLM